MARRPIFRSLRKHSWYYEDFSLARRVRKVEVPWTTGRGFGRMASTLRLQNVFLQKTGDNADHPEVALKKTS